MGCGCTGNAEATSYTVHANGHTYTVATELDAQAAVTGIRGAYYTPNK